MYYPLTQVDLPIPARADHTFAGWYTNPAFLGQPVTSVVMDRDRVVYAKWDEEVYYDKIRLVISLYNDATARQEVITHEPYYLVQVDDRGQEIRKTEHKYDGFTDTSTSKWFDEVEVPRGKYILKADDGSVLGQTSLTMVNTKIVIETDPDQVSYVYYSVALHDLAAAYCVLYMNRMLVINEDIDDRETNKANYGPVMRQMPTLTADNDWTPEWDALTINKVRFGSPTKPKKMDYWFNQCRNLTEISMAGLDTSECESMVATFQSCTSMRQIDCSIFDTGSVTDFSQMFASCQSTETILVSDDFVIPAGASSAEMFLDCNSLVGGNGTVFDSSRITAAMAHIDTAENPGYFTGV